MQPQDQLIHYQHYNPKLQSLDVIIPKTFISVLVTARFQKRAVLTLTSLPVGFTGNTDRTSTYPVHVAIHNVAIWELHCVWLYFFKDLFFHAQIDVSGARHDIKGKKKIFLLKLSDSVHFTISTQIASVKHRSQENYLCFSSRHVKDSLQSSCTSYVM